MIGTGLMDMARDVVVARRLARDVVPHVRDRRARAILRGIATSRVAALVPDVLSRLEDERRRLLQDERTLEGHDVSIAARTARISKTPAACRLLHVLARVLEPQAVVEMGTGVGISGAAIALGLPPSSRIWTIDASRAASDVAGDVFDRLSLSVNRVVGRFDDVLDGVLSEAAPVGLLYVDGHHEEEPTKAYFEQAVPHLAADAVVVFDDIRWSEGMERAWADLRVHPRFAFTADVHTIGIGAFEAV